MKSAKEIRDELREFISKKDFKKSVIPFQRKAADLLLLNDESLILWYEGNKVYSYIGYVFRELQDREDKSKYKRLCSKAENDEDFSDSEIEFIEQYEESHDIEDTIL